MFDKIITALSDSNSKDFARYTGDIWLHRRRAVTTALMYRELTAYIVNNISRSAVIILNSDRDFVQNGAAATNPSSLFTLIIGGNIVSRGVTFDNLLSMFFTRDVKQKIQQDTYIQRARMFGSRGKYLRFFELTIPQHLYDDWHRCFVFHRLALAAIREGIGSPVWLSDKRIAAVASSSIDRSTVDVDKGEMAFGMFKFDAKLDQIAASSDGVSERLEALSSALGDLAFPTYLKRYITRTSPKLEEALAIHESSSIGGYRDGEDGLDKSKIERRRGFMGTNQLEKTKYPRAVHHLKMFRNAEGNARTVLQSRRLDPIH